MVKIARHKDAFSEIFELQASPVEGQSLPQKDKKRRKKRRKKLDVGHYLQILISTHGHAHSMLQMAF